MPASELSSVREILTHLVAFDTTSHKTNLPMAEWVRAYLARHGVESRFVPSDNGIHSSLFATIGPAGEGGIGLSGHMDVVPVIGQPWDTDPFTVTEKDGRLYGRGTCDMKGFIACVLPSASGSERLSAGWKPTPLLSAGWKPAPLSMGCGK